MKIDDFKKCIEEKNRHNHGSGELHVVEYADMFKIDRLKKVYKLIDFKCGFNDKGRCKYSMDRLMYFKLKEQPNKTWEDTHCCCHSCKMYIGYLEMIPAGRYGFYAKHFSKVTGFWRKGKGCVLPHSHRSRICLSHNCNKDDDDFNDAVFEVSYTIRDLEHSIIMEDRKKKNES